MACWAGLLGWPGLGWARLGGVGPAGVSEACREPQEPTAHRAHGIKLKKEACAVGSSVSLCCDPEEGSVSASGHPFLLLHPCPAISWLSVYCLITSKVAIEGSGRGFLAPGSSQRICIPLGDSGMIQTWV